jgi:hypothetical protein
VPRHTFIRQLTGPAAAAVLGLDGYRDIDWPLLYCVGHSGKGDHQTLRVRNIGEPLRVEGIYVAQHHTVLRHLGEVPDSRAGSRGFPHTGVGLALRDRIEFAVEHCLRMGWVDPADLRNSASHRQGDRLLRELLDLRGAEPAAESYAEVQALQLFRDWGHRVYRQIPVIERGRLKHRIDFLVARPGITRRPEYARPDLGVYPEIDSREFHERQFEKDQLRQNTYDVLGLSWMTISPTMITKNPQRIRIALEQKLAAVTTASLRRST